VGLAALPARAGGVSLSGFRLVVRGRELRLGLPTGVAVPRAGFDAELVGAAVGAGVRFLPMTEARVESGSGSIRRVRLGRGGGAATVEARVVLAATGVGPA